MAHLRHAAIFEFTSAFGGEPEMTGRAASAASVENDPNRSLAALKSRIAALCRTEVCYPFVGSKGGIGQ